MEHKAYIWPNIILDLKKNAMCISLKFHRNPLGYFPLLPYIYVFKTAPLLTTITCQKIIRKI